MHHIATMQRTILAVFLFFTLSSIAQQTPPPATQALKSAPSSESNTSTTHELDTQAIVKETEQVEVLRHTMGVFWWVPTEFWEAAVRKQGYSSEEAHKVFLPFRGYNVFIVAVGDLGVGNSSWIGELDLKKSLVLRDQHGNSYKALAEVPSDVRAIVEVMKPVLKNMLGNFGEGLQFVVFPARDPGGNVFADPLRSSEISLDVADLMGMPTRTYTWRLPLSSLLPPKYCPVGKEKVEANWKYCPWHGNKLQEDAAPTKAAVPTNP